MVVNKAKLFQIPARLSERDFERIFVEYYARVHSILYRMTGDADEADDLAAETFWRLWERPPRQDENLGGWIYRVASRLGYNLMRANRRRQGYEEQAGRAFDQIYDPAEEAEKAIDRARVRQVLAQLPERDAQLLLLRHSGLAYKEIAAALAISPASVGTLLARAEERFEKRYRKGEIHAPKK